MREELLEIIKDEDRVITENIDPQYLSDNLGRKHGIGLSKQKYLLETTPAVNIALMRNIKKAFDQKLILNPGMSYGA
ncbi:FAD-linked oxidase C-terminal domain-containing protein [Butyrivibrio sp. AE3003]|uniref:FAD-linked oxidase C-terminal domain-containing protein n=1 Tax=Butyrivibrio sp. AE3003 TaxID=1496721 RepID=UPI00047ADFE5|nr:FAD-linked oxidase C-terminal domain-containing protein [Butyrivibrio sp. AE3003]